MSPLVCQIHACRTVRLSPTPPFIRAAGLRAGTSSAEATFEPSVARRNQSARIAVW